MEATDHNLKLPVSLNLKPDQEVLSKREKILQYYEEAGPDYQFWSPSYNMHFGFYEKGVNPFRREAMLNRMNEEVISRLQLKSVEEPCLADLGCGLGATARYAASRFGTRVKGVTIVPWQVRKGRELTLQSGLDKLVSIIESDYTSTSFKTASMDGAYAIESSCYANGASKDDLLQEAHRILKPGGKLVIADGFIKKVPSGGLISKAYNKLCECWVLKELGQIDKVKTALAQTGFKNIRVEDISWKVAPSVAHVPFVVCYFLLKQLFNLKQPMNRERWNNLTSPLLTMLLGLSRKHFGYYLITAIRN